MLNYVPHHFVADRRSRFQGRHVSRVVAGSHRLEAVRGSSAGRLAVVVAYGAKNQYALQIHTPSLTQEGKSLQRARVFHARNHVISMAAGIVASPGIRPL